MKNKALIALCFRRTDFLSRTFQLCQKKRLVMANLCKSFVRSFATSAQRANAFNHVTVIGGGLMGSGIAQV